MVIRFDLECKECSTPLTSTYDYVNGIMRVRVDNCPICKHEHFKAGVINLDERLKAIKNKE